MTRHTGLRLKLDIVITDGSPLPSFFTTLVLSAMGSCVARLVKVRNLVMMTEWIVSRSHTAVLLTKGVRPWPLLVVRRLGIARAC